MAVKAQRRGSKKVSKKKAHREQPTIVGEKTLQQERRADGGKFGIDPGKHAKNGWPQ